MHVLPLAVDFLPDAGLFDTADMSNPVLVERLGQPDVAQDGRTVAQQSHVRLAHEYVFGRLLRRSGQIEEILVKCHTNGQLPASFRLKTANRWFAERFVSLPVAADDGDQKSLIEFEQLLRQ